MSAFIVPNSVINKIVTSLRDNEAKWHDIRLSALDELGENDEVAVCQALLNMNYKAINSRYKENELPHTATFSYTPQTKVRVYKALRCFLYQCNEGEVYKTDLFKKLDSYKKDLASKIVESLDDYEAIKWGE